MTHDELQTLQAKLQNAITFGTGDMTWAKAQLAAVNAKLTQSKPLIVTRTFGEKLRTAGVLRGYRVDTE